MDKEKKENQKLMNEQKFFPFVMPNTKISKRRNWLLPVIELKGKIHLLTDYYCDDDDYYWYYFHQKS